MTEEVLAEMRQMAEDDNMGGTGPEVLQLLDEREALLKAAKDLASIVMYNEISDEQIALGQAAEAAIAKAEAP